MKKNNLCAMLAALILAAVFFTACGENEKEKEKAGVSYTLTIGGLTGGKVTIQQGASATISRTLAASDGSSTAGITFTYACTTAGHTNSATCGVSVNQAGTSVAATASAVTGDHAFGATAVKGGAAVATADFTVTVNNAAYALVIPPTTAKHGDVPPVAITPSTFTGDKTGIAGSVSECTTPGHTNCGITFTYNAQRSRFDTVNTIADTTPVGAHTYTATITKDGETLVTADFVLTIIPSYAFTVPPTFAVAKGGELELTWDLEASDGSDIVYAKWSENPPYEVTENGIVVGFSCTTHYGECNLFDSIVDPEEYVWGYTNKFTVPAEATATHAIKGEAKEAYPGGEEWIFLNEATSTINIQ